MFHKRSTIVCKFIGMLTTMAFVLCSCTAICPTRNDTVTLDLGKFLGEWFVVAGVPPHGNRLSKCGSVFVTSTSPDTFVMNYTARGAARKMPVTFIANVKLDDDVTGNWQLQGSNRRIGPLKHRVIDVNYNSYFAMIVCGDDSEKLVREFSMIWSREKTLATEILDKLKDKASSYIDRDKILDVDHSSC